MTATLMMELYRNRGEMSTWLKILIKIICLQDMIGCLSAFSFVQRKIPKFQRLQLFKAIHLGTVKALTRTQPTPLYKWRKLVWLIKIYLYIYIFFVRGWGGGNRKMLANRYKFPIRRWVSSRDLIHSIVIVVNNNV